MPTAELLQPDYSFRAVATVESQLRPKFLSLESPPRLRRDEGGALLRKSASLLELAAAASCMIELRIEENPDLSEKPSKEEAQNLFRRVKDRCGLDLSKVLRNAKELNALKESAGPPPPLRLPAVVRAMRALLEICPIEQLEQIGSNLHFETTGHRCRVAYDALKAFVSRNDPRQQRIVSLLGQKYQDGVLEVDDVAALLDVHPVDAVARLEEYGYWRPLDALALSAEQRAEIYAKMKADRAARSGKPTESLELIGRDVVASERIEGVDARRWIPREGF